MAGQRLISMTEWLQKNRRYRVLNEESLDYYKKKKEQGEDVQIVELSFDETFFL